MFSAVVCFASPSFAQPKENEETIKLNKKATEHFQNKEYKLAAEAFEKAEETANTKAAQAVLKKNAVISWYKAKMCPNAVKSAKKFLEYSKKTDIAQKDISDAKVVITKCQIDGAEAALAANKLKDADAALKDVAKYVLKEEDRTRYKVLKTQYDAKRKAEDERQKALKKKLEKPKPEPKTSTQAIVGWSLVGAGAATLVGNSIYTVVKNGSIQNDYNDAGCDKAEKPGCAAKREDAETAQTLSIVIYSVGAGLVIGGVTALLLDSPEQTDDEESVTWFPIVGKDQAGVGMSFRF